MNPFNQKPLTYEKMLDYLEERDPAWAKCRGGIEDFL